MQSHRVVEIKERCLALTMGIIVVLGRGKSGIVKRGGWGGSVNRLGF